MTLTYRDATADDLGFIVRLIVEDNVVATADRPDEPHHPRYLAARAAALSTTTRSSGGPSNARSAAMAASTCRP